MLSCRTTPLLHPQATSDSALCLRCLPPRSLVRDLFQEMNRTTGPQRCACEERSQLSGRVSEISAVKCPHAWTRAVAC